MSGDGDNLCTPPQEKDVVFVGSKTPSTTNSPSSRPDRPWTRESLSQEIIDLKEALRFEQPLAAPASEGDESFARDRRKMVARLVEGKASTLNTLTREISSCLCETEGASTRDTILDVATRKYYGHREGKPSNIDTFNDETLAPFWFWELRSVSDIPEDIKAMATLARRKRKKVQERLNAIHDYLKLTGDNLGKQKVTETKMQKAVQKLRNTDGLDTILAYHNSRQEEEKQKVLAREQHASARASEKAEQSAQRAVQKETQAAKALGWASKKSLARSQNMLLSFAKPVPRKEVANPIAASESDNFDKRFPPCPPQNRLHMVPSFDEAQQALDNAIATGITEDEARSNFANSLARWQEDRKNRTPFSGSGSTYIEIVGENGDEKSDRKVARKKYLWFPCDSDCPPYYGGWPSSSVRPSGRKPLEVLPGVDYEEMFDEGWEGEPEGESLSEDEDGEEDAEDRESQDDFVVDDGYLSADEGIMEVELEDFPGLQDIGAPTLSLHSNQASEKQWDVLRKIWNLGNSKSQHILLVRSKSCDPSPHSETLDPNKDSRNFSAHAEFLHGLKSSWRIAQRVSIPSMLDQPDQVRDADTKNSRRGGPAKHPMTPEMTANLTEILRPGMRSREKVVETFLSQNPDSRISKTTVREKIGELAQYDSSRGWILKSENGGSEPNSAQPDTSPGTSMKPEMASIHEMFAQRESAKRPIAFAEVECESWKRSKMDTEHMDIPLALKQPEFPNFPNFFSNPEPATSHPCVESDFNGTPTVPGKHSLIVNLTENVDTMNNMTEDGDMQKG